MLPVQVSAGAAYTSSGSHCFEKTARSRDRADLLTCVFKQGRKVILKVFDGILMMSRMMWLDAIVTQNGFRTLSLKSACMAVSMDPQGNLEVIYKLMMTSFDPTK